MKIIFGILFLFSLVAPQNSHASHQELMNSLSEVEGRDQLLAAASNDCNLSDLKQKLYSEIQESNYDSTADLVSKIVKAQKPIPLYNAGVLKEFFSKEQVEALLKNGLNPNAITDTDDLVFRYYDTLLNGSAKVGASDAVKLLLKAGANPNLPSTITRGSEGGTIGRPYPLSSALPGTSAAQAVRNAAHQKEVVEASLKAGARIDLVGASNLVNFAKVASHSENNYQILQLLVENGLDPSAKIEGKNTFLNILLAHPGQDPAINQKISVLFSNKKML